MAKLKATAPVSVEALDVHPLPPSTETFHPVAHGSLHSMFLQASEAAGLTVVPAKFQLAPNGEMAIGTYNLIDSRLDGTETKAQIGWFNSWDKSCSARMYMADEIKWCTNGMVFAMRVLARKHTTNIMADLPGGIAKAMSDAVPKFLANRVRIETYKSTALETKDADHLLMEHWRQGILGDRQLKRAHSEWVEPTYSAFKPRSVWSFHNAITESLKSAVVFDAPHLTTLSNDILDSYTNFSEPAFAGAN